MRELNGSATHPLKEEMEEILDQSFYCMYGHPNKKTKARHLQDHGVAQVTIMIKYYSVYVWPSQQKTKAQITHLILLKMAMYNHNRKTPTSGKIEKYVGLYFPFMAIQTKKKPHIPWYLQRHRVPQVTLDCIMQCVCMVTKKNPQTWCNPENGNQKTKTKAIPNLKQNEHCNVYLFSHF